MSAVTVNRRFVDRVVLITGGGSGIGEAMALAFAHEGGRVVVVDRDADGASRVASSIVASGGVAVAETADVALASDMQRVIDGAVARWGRIDVLCNNAGIGIAAVCHETSESDWDLTMAIDLKGVFLGCKYAIPHMLRHGGGHLQYVVGCRSGWRPEPRGVLLGKGRRARIDEVNCHRLRGAQHPLQCFASGYRRFSMDWQGPCAAVGSRWRAGANGSPPTCGTNGPP